MANKTFSRGIEALGAEASMVFIGNTSHNLPYMLKHSDLFDDLPEGFHDSAFLDRLHCYIPGWEIDIIRGEMFSDGYGFVVDYLAEILRGLRNHDYSNLYSEYFTVASDISTRDRDGINKTFSGLMKILHPGGTATEDQIEEVLRFAMEGRKRVKDQLMRIDATYVAVNFEYENRDGIKSATTTLEEEQYPEYCDNVVMSEEEEELVSDESSEEAIGTGPKEQHVTIQENQRGISYDDLFGPYLKDASKIVITDAYIRYHYQARNLMELMETIIKQKSDDDEVEVQLITVEDEQIGEDQSRYLGEIESSCATAGIRFTWRYEDSSKVHARHIVTDHGWKILLDRGLDVFQRYEMNDTFGITNRMQKYRSCKPFEVTYLRTDK